MPKIANQESDAAANSRMCTRCQKALVAIGSSRSNGSTHQDWDSRAMHKKCWKQHYDEITLQYKIQDWTNNEKLNQQRRERLGIWD